MIAGLSTGAALLVAKIEAAPAGLAQAFGGPAVWHAAKAALDDRIQQGARNAYVAVLKVESGFHEG